MIFTTKNYNMTSLLMNKQLKLGPALSGLFVLRKVMYIYLNHLIDALFKHWWTLWSIFANVLEKIIMS